MQSSDADNVHSKRRWQDYSFIKDEVAKILKDHPEGLTGAKIAELVGITQGAMSKYLSMLKVDGIITSRKVGVAKLWKLVSQSDRTGILADKMGGSEEEATFRDYAVSLVEENNRLFEADGKRVIVMPTSMLSNLYRYTRSVIGTEVHAFFYQWGKDYAAEVNKLVADVAKKMDRDFIESFLLLWRLKGWGRFEVILVEDNAIEIVWYDSIWAKEVDEKVAVDDFVAGALAAAASYSMGGSWNVKEVACRANGEPHCRFKGTRIG
jgi:predicted hydrocarbon binding protein